MPQTVVNRELSMLDDFHRRELLEKSSIDPEVAAERGYFSIMRPNNCDNRPIEQLKSYGIPTWAFKEAYYFPGLVIPWYRPTGELSQRQWKPRNPVPNREGKFMKYASPRGCSSQLDVHPRWSRDGGDADPDSIPAIRNVQRPLFITEGIKKADSLTSRGMVTVALNGVYNWRNSLGTLGGWEDIPLKGRTVTVVFDADATSNRMVLTAMGRIGRWLKSKGATVKYAIPPAKRNGVETKGIDDFFAAGGEWGDVDVRSTPPMRNVADVNKYTDAALSEEIAQEALEDRFCWCRGLGGWLQYNGSRWAHDESTDGAVLEAVRQYTRDQYLAAVDAKRKAIVNDDQKAKDAAEVDEAGWAKYQSAAKLEAVVKLAKGIQGIGRRAEEFDQDPDVLNTPTGVLHLETGVLEPHNATQLVTKITAVGYKPGATDDAFTQALAAIPDGAAMWLQLRMGQACTGHPSDKFIMCSGGGANGKTTLISSLYRALGGRLPGGAGYSTLVANKLLLGAEQSGGATPERMDLRACRLAYLEETPEDRYLDTQTLKELVDVPAIKGRYLFKDLVEWAPSHTMILNTNHPPQVTQTDHGTWRRLTNIEFPYRFRYTNDGYGNSLPNDRQGDPGIKDKLKRDSALEAALAWMVDGAMDWYRGGRTLSIEPDPACVVESTKRWRHDSDIILGFVEEVCVMDPNCWVSFNDLYAEFSAFVTLSGQKVPSSKLFSTRLVGHTGLSGQASLCRRRHGQDGESRKRLTAFDGGSVRPAGKQVRAVSGIRFLEEQK